MSLPEDMTRGVQRRFRVGDLAQLHRYVEKFGLEQALDGIASLHHSRKQLKMLVDQLGKEIALEDSEVSEGSTIYLHAMTYDELQDAWFKLIHAAGAIQRALDWIATGEPPVPTEAPQD
jgi:hypothetical protein